MAPILHTEMTNTRKMNTETGPRPVLTSVLCLSVGACAGVPRVERGTAMNLTLTYTAKSEVVEDFGAMVFRARANACSPTVESEPTVVPGRLRLERVTAGVPWPRGLAFVDGELIVLARGRHRRAGGIDAAIRDLSGSLLAVDPEVSEPVVAGRSASVRTRENAKLLTAPDGGVFQLYDPRQAPIESVAVDRPYCTLVYDERSRNLFVCGYSGVDLPGARFRKNASDSIHRFDLRAGRWFPVEMHRYTSVPRCDLGYVVPNQYYPHHDPKRNRAPHGWLNGPDACGIAGDFLYAAGKDNHVVAGYDLSEIRIDPKAGPPASRPVLGPRVQIRMPGGRRRLIEALGPSALEGHGGFLYVGYRTSSIVLRFPVDGRGALAQPVVGELVAVFEPWSRKKRRSANLIDLAFNSAGELFVSCAKEARIWRVGVPDPERPFYGDDQSARPTTAPPYVDIRKWTGKTAGCGNLAFDSHDRLYFCVGNYDHGNTLAGAVYRTTTID